MSLQDFLVRVHAELGEDAAAALVRSLVRGPVELDAWLRARGVTDTLDEAWSIVCFLDALRGAQ